MEFIDFSAGQAASQESTDQLAANAPQSLQHYPSVATSYPGGDPPKPTPYMNPNFPPPMSCDIKPRLTKEQHDILEAHFQKQNKPNTNTKKTFAESLNVSLDKVNNWFQNRRAKSKQDARKKQDSVTLSYGPHGGSSDTELSPGYADPNSQYHALLQHWSAEQRVPNGLGISRLHHGSEHATLNELSFEGGANGPSPFNPYLGGMHVHPDMYSSQEELNRRTLTQDQFAAMERDGGMVTNFGTFEDFEATFNGNQAVMNTIFPSYNGEYKANNLDHFLVAPPLTSYDSTVPSNISVESLPMFPSGTQMQPYANMSATSSEWTDSRSSSVTHLQHQTPASTSQWQPGQSVPVDASQQQEEFRQVAARASYARGSPPQPMQEHMLPWSEEALARRASSASLIQSMGDIGIQTPPQHQNGTFKSPAPPANIAARRQRPRPAALGVAALRSQSHSGPVQPGSPSHIQSAHPSTADQSLRRIRSTNFLSNGVPGRVMKSTPGSAQRSPLNFTFADAMNSPHALRHTSGQSQGSMAPPTPMSPKETHEVDEVSQVQQHWQAAFGNGPRQASITETEAEHAQNFRAMAGLPGQQWTSPPHTPMYPQHHMPGARFNGQTIMEYTPPQSAPASQKCFPFNVFAVPHPPQQQQMPQPPPVPSQHIAVVPMSHPPPPPQFLPNAVTEPDFQMSNMSFTPMHNVNMASAGPAPGLPIHFANGVPITNSDGNIEMYFPAAHHFVQHQQQQVQMPHSQGHTPPQQHMHTPPQKTYPFVVSATGSPSSQAPAMQASKSASDLCVHEYTPPESVKRAATPRKGPVDSVPKNYAFANTGPEYFEEKKGGEDKRNKRFESVSSSSPASSSGGGNGSLGSGTS